MWLTCKAQNNKKNSSTQVLDRRVSSLNNLGDKFGWAYIGAGSIARQTAENILPTGKHRIVSVYNRTYSKAEDFASTFSGTANDVIVPCYTIDEALSAPGVDAVYIATTNDNHYTSAKECLRAGKPVLLEKPFAINKTEALELVSIAREKNLYLAEAMWTWFSPVSLKVKEWVDNGELGDIEHIEINYVNRVSHLYPRLFDVTLGGGALLDIGIYPIAYLYNLFGYPTGIHCTGNIKNGIDTDEIITLSFTGGLSVNVEVSIVKSPGYENLIITGTNGTINCPNYHMANRAELIKPAGSIEYEGNGWYDNQFNIVAGEIKNGKLESEYVPLNATLDIMEIMDECRAQMGLRYPFEKL